MLWDSRQQAQFALINGCNQAITLTVNRPDFSVKGQNAQLIYQQPPLSVTQSRWHFFAGA
jgi:hypothetical protein